jgi:hypothetical protein
MNNTTNRRRIVTATGIVLAVGLIVGLIVVDRHRRDGHVLGIGRVGAIVLAVTRDKS